MFSLQEKIWLKALKWMFFFDPLLKLKTEATELWTLDSNAILENYLRMISKS